MHYLITGHNGFKGSWLSLMLHLQGHTVSGISLEPEEFSLFQQANLKEILLHDLHIDIRNSIALTNAVRKINPEIIIHLAAQPLVRESYKDPIGTFTTNVIGTLNLLESTKILGDLKATLIITTDKVYKNFNHTRGYTELDELGGDDPYSASKAAADIAAQSWISCFAKSPTSIARAGNVIGGGDWALDRIIPDIVNAYSKGMVPTLRYPSAVRPWQHVLDCLNGYLTLVNEMLSAGITGEWNFGPNINEKHTVSSLVEKFANVWGVDNSKNAWNLETLEQPKESGYLLLDSTKSFNILGWKDVLTFDECIEFTVEWYKKYQSMNPQEIMQKQINLFSSKGES